MSLGIITAENIRDLKRQIATLKQRPAVKLDAKGRRLRLKAERSTNAWLVSQRAERRAWNKMEKDCNASVGHRSKWAKP